MDLSILPFTTRLPAGFSLSSTAPQSSGTNTTSASNGTKTAVPMDVISLSSSWDVGKFTAAAGDSYRLGDLFRPAIGGGQSASGYRVALGAGSGTLLLDSEDVSDRTSFTAGEFARLVYQVGDSGSQQALVVAVQTGTPRADGTLSHTADSPAVQITAAVTGTRSINAMNALVAMPDDADAAAASVVKEASVLTGTSNASRPNLATVGNFTAAAGDSFRLSDLFRGSTNSGQAIAGFRVALSAGGGQLLLDDADVSARTSFTAGEFARLVYKAGADASQQSLVVAAQTGTRAADGTLSHVADSQAVQVAAAVTGTRSLNAMGALVTTPADDDAAMVALAKEAGILTGTVQSGRPSLYSRGNFTAVVGDDYRLGDLFKASAPGGQPVAGFRVALGSGDGMLLLDDEDVSGRTSFTADEFAHLIYRTGSDGTQQSLVVAAQTGTRLADGSLTHVADSPAVQITAAVAGSRSINAMNALVDTPAGAGAAVAALVKEAGILTGSVSTGRPTLQTDGNLTAAAADSYRLGDLFKASAPSGQSIAGYRIALGAGSGTLLLDGTDVSDRTSFTADDFAHLVYQAGAGGSQQDLVVAAQTGTRAGNGTLTHVADSEAVQITATVDGVRSINAMNALVSTPADGDANVVEIVKQASILTGAVGSSRPTLRTDGNFTATAGEQYRLSDLFKASATTGRPAAYRVALGAGSGALLLNSEDVSERTSFSADEFAHLLYQAGTGGSRQDIVVVAQNGIPVAGGGLSHVTDSHAMQITAAVTGARSINAMNALVSTPTDADARVAALVKEASILSGSVGSTRPAVQTVVALDPALPLAALAIAPGGSRSAGAAPAGTEFDLAALYPGAIGGLRTAGSFADPRNALTTALLLLGGTGIGAFQEAGGFDQQAQAIRAYAVTRKL